GDYNPLLGLTYEQVSRLGLGHQRSQNGGTGMPPAEEQMSPYHRFASVVSVPQKESTFFDGIDVSLAGIASLAQGGDASFLNQDLGQINASVEKAFHDFSAQDPEAIAGALAEGLKSTNELLQKVNASNLSDDSKYDIAHELKVKQVQFENALAESLGISVLATLAPEKEPSGPFARFFRNPETFQVAIPGQQFWVKIHTTNPTNLPVEVESVSLETPQGEQWNIAPEGQTRGTLKSHQSMDVRFTVNAPQNAGYTRPYFSRPDIEQPYYNIDQPQYLNLPLAPHPLAAKVKFSYDGTPFELSQVVQSVKRVTGPGTVLEPVIVAPA